MNYYIAGLFSTLISIFIFRYYWWNFNWVGKDKTILYVIPTLLLSAIVNIFIKKPIYNQLYTLFNISKEVTLWPLWFIPIVTVIGAFAEEFIKILPILTNKILLREKIDIYFSALLTGFGFGIGEIWYLCYRLSKTQPQYASGFINLILLSMGFGGERIIAVLLHIIFIGIVGYGFILNQPLKYFLLAILLHSVINIPAGLYQTKKVYPLISIVLIIIIFCLILFYFSPIDEDVKKRKGFKIDGTETVIYKK